jgi:hypothetical protein
MSCGGLRFAVVAVLTLALVVAGCQPTVLAP